MQASLRKVIWNDWPALAASVAVPIVWILHFGLPLLQGRWVVLPLWYPAAASVLVVAALVWRVRRIEQLFSRATPAVGVITNLYIAKDRGRLVFAFEHEGRRVHAWMPVHRTRAVLALVPGQRVDVLFDPSRPKRAIVRSLFER